MIRSPAPPSAVRWPAGLDRFAVVLVRPDSPENIGLAARGMANTGFSDLRIVGLGGLEAAAYRTAVHAHSILDRTRFYETLGEAVDGFHLVLGSTARVRRDFPLVTAAEAVRRILEYPPEARVALVFGNERTGLTAREIGLSNIRFRIPQAARQPSYNLGVAVTLTLFEIAGRGLKPAVIRRDLPLTQAEQEEAGRRFSDLLDSRGFMHDTSRAFITERVRDIFRRMVLTAEDRDIILAMFRKGYPGGPLRKAQERSGNGTE
jgi:TrmH family RNA methyltransferase